METWKIVDQDSSYEVSTLGRLRRVDTGEVLSGSVCDGYIKHRLGRKAGYKLVPVHRLVAEAFIPKGEMTVNHLNGNKLDNRAENLEWCSRSENVQHAHTTGLNRVPRGQDCRWSKLTDEIVSASRAKFHAGEATIKGMARELGVSPKTMRRAVRGRSWSHV